MVDSEGVRKKVPDPRDVPPVGVSYQFRVPALAVALKVNVPESQRDAGTVATMAGVGLAEANTATRVEVQLPSVAST